MKKAVLYARVSSREQEDGYSLEAQIKLGRSYADKLGLNIAREFSVAESAKSNGRETFEKMVQFLKDNSDIEIILCEKTDRLLRGDLKDRLVIEDLINDFNKEIHIVKESLVLNKNTKSFQKLQFDLQNVLARNFLNNLSDEVKKSYDVMVDDGKYPHPPPIGYLSKLENHLAVVDKERAPFILKAFELASEGNYSEKAISEVLYKEGFRSRNGKQVGKSDIGGILHNPFYYGDFRWKGEVRKGVHPPIISKALFNKVQEMLSPRGRNKGITHRFAYAGGLLTCGYCGNGITAEIQKGHVYYHCTKPKGSRSCPGKYVREETIEEQLKEIIKTIGLTEKTLALIKTILRKSHTEEEEYHLRSLEALQSRYNVIKEKLDKLLDAYIDGGISKDIYSAKAQELEKERGDINSQINKHKDADKAYFEQIENFLEVAHQAPDLFLSSKPELKRELLKFVVSNLLLTDRKLVPTFRLPFSLLVDYAKNENWQGRSDSN